MKGIKKLFSFEFWQKIREGTDGGNRGNASGGINDQYRKITTVNQ